jgi:hypothetical protein
MQLPIWRDLNRLLLEIELAVRTFSRYHKYTLGSDMRRQAMDLCRLLSRAMAVQDEARLERVRALQQALDDLKITLQLAKELHAYQSFAQFQRIIELAVASGKQVGAWGRSLTRGGSASSSQQRRR